MNFALKARLNDLYKDGQGFDAAESDRVRRRRNLEPETAELLTLVLRIAKARAVVEIGTGNGYATAWLADAVRDTGGCLVSVDLEAPTEAVVNLAGAELGNLVTFEVCDGGEYLSRLPDGSVDLLFLDAERTHYAGWWPEPSRVLRPGGVLAVDNVLSHPDEVAEFLGLVGGDETLEGTTVPVGKGLYVARRKG